MKKPGKELLCIDKCKKCYLASSFFHVCLLHYKSKSRELRKDDRVRGVFEYRVVIYTGHSTASKIDPYHPMNDER